MIVVSEMAAALAADRVNELVDELTATFHVQLSTLACMQAFQTWQRGDPAFKPRLSGRRRWLSCNASGTVVHHGSSQHQSDALHHLRPLGCDAWPPPIGPSRQEVAMDKTSSANIL